MKREWQGARAEGPGELWALVDEYMGRELTVVARRMQLPGATVYRVTIEEPERLGAVFLVPETSERVPRARWEVADDGRQLRLRVAGGTIAVDLREQGPFRGFHARFVPARPVQN